MSGSTSLPGGVLDNYVGQVLGIVDGVSQTLTLIDKITYSQQLVTAISDFVDKRAHEFAATTVAEARAAILDELSDTVSMAQALSGLLLPNNFPVFFDLDQLVNGFALGLGQELNALTGVTTLPPLDPSPFTLNNAEISTLDEFNTVLQNTPQFKLSFPGDTFVKGGLKVIGASKFNAGILQLGSPAPSGGNFTVQLVDGASLTMSGKAILQTGAKLIGTGLVHGISILSNGALFGPGNSPGSLTLDAPFTMTSGSFEMEIGGTASGSFDQVSFTQSVDLEGGTIDIKPISGFKPSVGTTIQLFTANGGPLDFSHMTVHFGDFGGLVGSLRSDGTVVFQSQGGVPPVITSGGAAILPENTPAATVVYKATATDADPGSTITFSLTGTDASLFSIGANDGSVRFLTSPDYEAPADKGANNVYDVVVHANDGVNDVTKSVAITVTNVPGETWTGGNGGQTHVGTPEDDTLTGGNAKDVIDGAAGNDKISAGNGADTVIGGPGDDLMTGGNGPDVFVFAAGFGKDILTDFTPKLDVLQFKGGVFANAGAVLNSTSNAGGSAVISLDANNTITLQGVSKAQLSSGDFQFA